MKKTFITVIEMFLLVCSSSFSQQIVETKYFSNHNELGGDVIILKQFQRVEGTKSITSFEIKSPRSGRYYISFWLCPPKLNLAMMSQSMTQVLQGKYCQIMEIGKVFHFQMVK